MSNEYQIEMGHLKFEQHKGSMTAIYDNHGIKVSVQIESEECVKECAETLHRLKCLLLADDVIRGDDK